MDFNKLKLTEAQKTALIALGANPNGLPYYAHEKAFQALLVLELVFRTGQYTQEQIGDMKSDAWKVALDACRTQDVQKLHKAYRDLDCDHSLTKVYRLTELGVAWIDYWKVKQTGVEITLETHTLNVRGVLSPL